MTYILLLSIDKTNYMFFYYTKMPFLFVHTLFNSWKGEHSTNQRNRQGKEPGVDEKVVSTNLDDVQEQRGDGQQDALGHKKLLYSILQEEPHRLRGRPDRSIKTRQWWMTRAICQDVCAWLNCGCFKYQIIRLDFWCGHCFAEHIMSIQLWRKSVITATNSHISVLFSRGVPAD